MSDARIFVLQMARRLSAAERRGQVELHISLPDVAHLVRLARYGARVVRRLNDASTTPGPSDTLGDPT